ncbi:MAG: DegT/DnrJ/EryC1/StrS family aminotransferase [Ignavibacteriae bacterium]|nr:DegT/DnrJ/EryC1/StrS family aminotransferase [Ignavibacteriota bacterium]
MNIQMVDVVTQYKKIKPEIDAAVLRVLESGHYILGKEVTDFEMNVAKYFGVKHAIGCASGTDALQIALMALNIGPGDEVITTPFTFVATTETIALLGAKPVYVDIDPATYNIDPALIDAAITKKTKAILPVHLYGHSVDMDPLHEVAQKHNIPIIEDTAQAIGAKYKGKKVGGLGAIGCVSFYPSKNLGAFGDGGLLVTNDDTLAEKIRVIGNHGSRIRYTHEILGVNSRLDAIQAAILNVKLRYLDEWHEARRTAAQRYNKLLGSMDAVCPVEAPYAYHIYHQYTVRVRQREKITKRLAEQKIPHAIYYPIPLHFQEAFRSAAYKPGSFPLTERAATEVLSLPMHTELTEEEQHYIVEAFAKAIA